MKTNLVARLIPLAAVIAIVLVSGSVRMIPSFAQAESNNESNSAKGNMKPVETDMHEFMEYVNQPTYKRLKAAMKSEPTDNQGWLELKSGSLILAETGNLILLRGPEEDRDEWIEYATAVRDDASQMYRAAHDKDFTKAAESYRQMLNSCNSCHDHFAGGEPNLSP